MKSIAAKFLCFVISFLCTSTFSIAQMAQSSSVFGVVKDPNGAVIAGATVSIKNQETGIEQSTVTNATGNYSFVNVPIGQYELTISANGFTKSTVRGITTVNKPVMIDVVLQVSGVIVDGDCWVCVGEEIIYDQTDTISRLISERQIKDVPAVSQNAINLALLEPGFVTVGRPRQSTVNGLPKGAINITLDGINIQDNALKSGDGFFPFIEPRIDFIEEMRVVTAVPDSRDSKDGAAQIALVTRSGTNEFHGSLYEYLRNSSLNANNYFVNLFGAPRPKMILNQFGGQLGGPISKDKAFFFVDYEEYRLPTEAVRTKTIFDPSTLNGNFQYISNTGVFHSVNLFNLAAANSQTSTIDPTVGALLNLIQASTSRGVVFPTGDPNRQTFFFNTKDNQIRRFPATRFDYHPTSSIQFSNTYAYQQFGQIFDLADNAQPAFPGFPNFGSQRSNRFLESFDLSYILNPNMVNEFRFGFTGGTLRMFPEVAASQFANQGGFSLNLGSAGISNATAVRSPIDRNSPIWQFDDNFAWVRGNHASEFGFSFTQAGLFTKSVPGGVVPVLSFGVGIGDLAGAMFTPSNFPGASFTQINQASNIYALLTGRITSESGDAVINENGDGYTNSGNYIERDRQRETGLFAMDSWRVTRYLTLNFGLRWEVQFPMTSLNHTYSQTPFDQLFGISGPGNLFKPGTMTGTPTQFTDVQPGTAAYNTDWGNFAPHLGFAWSTGSKHHFLKTFLGEPGNTVIRGGYSVAYIREGMDVISNTLSSNPGSLINTSVSQTSGTLTNFPVLLRDGAPGLLPAPSSVSFPILGTLNDTANAFIPNLKTGRVHSWSFGIQRQLGYSNAVEIRYVGNRAMDMWRQYNINEVDVVENGFINEFKLAEANLLANDAAGGARFNSFAFFGPGTGTAPLPIILGFFNGVPASSANDPSKYTSNFFHMSSFISALQTQSALNFANFIVRSPSTFAASGLAAGIPANFFVVNPGVSEAFLVDNSNRSYYDGLQVEYRRRLSRGILVDASYVFSKSLTNYYASNPEVFKNFISLHDPRLDRGISPFDITHAFKTRFIYDLPVGHGHKLIGGDNGIVSRVFSGWTIAGTSRIQSGTPFSLGNVQLIGMTGQQLQDMVKIRHTVSQSFFINGVGTPVVTYLPDNIIQGTIAAFNGQLPTTSQYIAPAGLGTLVPFPGAAGYSNLVLHGPRFTRFDLSVIKRTKINDKVNFEFRAEFLNAFNNVNFMVTDPSSDVGTVGAFNSNTFGQVPFSYSDLIDTNDPGGRIIQFVAKINF